MTKKILSVLLAIAMLATTFTTSFAYAAIDNLDGEDDTPVSTNIDNLDGEDEDIQDEIDGLKNLLAAYDEGSVTNQDTAKLAEIKAEADAMLANLADKISDNQKAELEKVSTDAKALQDKVAAADKAVNDAVAAANAIKTVDASNVDAAKKAVADIDAALASTNLTDAQKAELNAAKAALQKAIDAYKPAQQETPSTPSQPENPSQPTTPEQPAAPADELNVGDVENNKDSFSLNAGLKVTNTGKTIGVKWGKVPGADGYLVYVQYCGKNFSKSATKTVKGAKTTSCTIKKVNGKNISTTKNFKVYVAAYKNVDGKKVVLAKTIVAHVVGAKNKKYTNVKKLTVSKSSYTLKKGKTATIKAKTTLVDKKKKQLTNSHAKQFRYKSTDSKVATVSSKGKIKAVGKGKCKVYVYARNGYAKAITVTVK